MFITKLCPKCKIAVPTNTVRCPHCKENYTAPKNNYGAILFICGCIVFFICLGLLISFLTSSRSANVSYNAKKIGTTISVNMGTIDTYAATEEKPADEQKAFTELANLLQKYPSDKKFEISWIDNVHLNYNSMNKGNLETTQDEQQFTVKLLYDLSSRVLKLSINGEIVTWRNVTPETITTMSKNGDITEDLSKYGIAERR